MSIDAGSIQASLHLDVSQFGQGIATARAQLQAFSEAASAIDGTLSALQQAVNNSYQSISQAASVAAKTMVDENSKAAGQMKTALSEMTASTQQILESFQSNVTSNMRTAAAQMQSAGAFMGDGLISGVLSRIPAAISAGSTLAKAVEQGAKVAAQIHSPSRVFIEIGKNMDEGLALGIQQNQYMAVDEMTAAANALLDTGNAISTGLIQIDQTTGSILFDSAYQALMTKTDLYITERNQRVMNVTEGTEETIRQIERETRATEDAYDIKIKLYEQEMYAKLSLIDEATGQQVAQLRKQIDDISDLNEQDRKKEAALLYEEQLAQKQKALSKAETAEETERILAQIETLKRNREKTLLQEQRKEEQDALRQQILELQAKAKADKDALRDEFEAKKYQLLQKQEAEISYLKEMQSRLEDDAKMRKELEEVQTKLKQAEEKKRSQSEIAELKAREKELLLSLSNNKTALTAFTIEVEKIGKDYGKKLIAGFRSTEDEIVDYLQWIARQAQQVGQAVAEAKEGKTETVNSFRRTVAVMAEEGQRYENSEAVMARNVLRVSGYHSTNAYGIYQVAQKQQVSGFAMDYDKLAQAIAANIRPSVNMENHFTSPRALSESEIRKNQELLLRELAFRF